MAGRDGDAGELLKLLDPQSEAEARGDGSTASTRRIRPTELPGILARAAGLAWRAAPRELVLCACLQAASGVGVALQLLLGRTVIQAVVQDKVGEGLRDVAPNLIGLAVVTAVVALSSAVLTERQLVLSALVERHVQDRILDVVAEVDLASFETADFHDLLRRAAINASERSWQVSQAIVAFFSAFATFTALAVVLGRIEPLLVPGVVLAYLPLHFATTRNGRASYEFHYAMTAPDREHAYLGSVLRGRNEAKEVRLFGSASWLRGRYDGLYDRRIAELRALSARRLRRSLLAGGGTVLVTILGVGLLIHWALSGRLEPAEAGVAAVALQQLGTRMRSVGQSAGTLHECSLFLEDVTTFLRHPTERTEPSSDQPTAPAFDRVAVEGVSFTYPGTDREVLHDISLDIGAEEVVALVGANGSGKTTLAKLLCGLYQPTAGRVLWDGEDVAHHDVSWVRRRVAAVFQDFVRYELTGHQNIALGDVARAEDADGVHLAARAAGADDVLAGLPDGYDTRLSREYAGGADLSIGEWQRVALARAFFRDAPFLVLDEPTAALDAHAEHELFGAIRLLQHGRAVLLISHRFSSVRSADRIYVLDRGQIIESGSHDALMARGGRYAELFTLQAAAYLDDEPASGMTST